MTRKATQPHAAINAAVLAEPILDSTASENMRKRRIEKQHRAMSSVCLNIATLMAHSDANIITTAPDGTKRRQLAVQRMS